MYSEQALMDYHRIEKAIAFIKKNQAAQPSLEAIASHVHLSPYHFQRLFTRWAGISPKKFLQYLTLQYARKILDKNQSLAQVAADAGLSGPGRLHDLFVGMEGMTPEQYRRSGKGLCLYHGFFYSPFGKYLLAVTDEKRICCLQFIEDEASALGALKAQWSGSTLRADPGPITDIADKLFAPRAPEQLKLLLRGTPFQLKVWEALLKIPFGELVSYQVIAAHVDKPGGLQAVGSAIGRNPIAYLVPCHRVLKKTGQISEYRWGRDRKWALLGWEAALRE